jgi:exonuclease VII large subunit
MVEKLEKDYQEKLKKRDLETYEIRKELNMVKYELREAHRRLELPVSMQLAEARRKIQELETKVACDNLTIGEMKLEQDSNEIEDPADKSTKERKLEKKVKSLQNQLENGSKTIERLQNELEEERKRSNEKEMQYRRLIATSCGLPIEKVDALVQPLTLAIESDPPDLDMARVIGFMERLRRQPASNVSSPHDPNTTTTPV